MQIGTIVQLCILLIGIAMIVSPAVFAIETQDGFHGMHDIFNGIKDSILIGFIVITIGWTAFFLLAKIASAIGPMGPSFAIVGFIIVFTLLAADRTYRFMRRKKVNG